MGQLDGKRAIITGGGNGIGAAAARLFAQEGAAVTILDVDREAGERSAATAEAAGGRCLFLDCDIAEPKAVEAAVERSVAAFGGLEVLYNNAGGATARDGSLVDMPLEEFWRTISVDLYGSFLTARFALPHLKAAGGGSVINTTSIRAMKGTKGADAYSAAKGGIVALTKAMALQWGPQGIRVNAIAPGPVLTERTRGLGMTEEPEAQWGGVRPGRPEEVAAMALFLASDAAAYVNGAIIPVDGGAAAF